MDEIQKMLSSGIQKFIYSSMPGKPVINSGSVQMSKHKKTELLFVIRGRSCFQMNDKIYELEPGDMCLIEPWCPHAFGYSRNDRDLLHLWLSHERDHFRGRIIQVKEKGVFTICSPTIIFPSYILDLFKSRWQILNKEEVITEEFLNKYFRAVLNLILDEMLLHLERIRSEKRKDEKANLAESIKQCISTRQGRHCSLAEIEVYTGYNRFYISHLFKEKTGLSIGEYINDVRAKYTVEAEQHGIKYTEIAEQLGFSSIQAFGLWKRHNKIRLLKIKESILSAENEASHQPHCSSKTHKIH